MGGDIKRFIYSKLYRFKPEILAQKDALKKGFALTGAPLIGAHMRRGDKFSETQTAALGGDVFAKVIREECTKLGHEACDVFVASDDPAAKAELPESLVVTQDDLSPELYTVRNLPTEDDTTK